MKTLLEIEGLTIARAEKILSDGLGVFLPSGAILCVQGKNGVGKSTLLATLAGIRPPKSGFVKVWDEDIYKERLEYAEDVGFLGHSLALWPGLSVLENISFFARVTQSMESIEASLAYWELEELAQESVRKLSAGWQKRVALARLMAMNSNVWILDEPFAALDSAAKQRLENAMEIRAQEGVVVYSHHGALQNPQHVILQMEDFIP
jgi:heme exporter protein A